jgi:hypothetical protein
MVDKPKNWFQKLSRGKKFALVVVGLLVIYGVAAAATSPPHNKKVTLEQAKATKPAMDYKTVTNEVPIPFKTTKEDDSGLPKGQTKVMQIGSNGEKIITYKIAYKNGVEISRQKITEQVLRQPTDEIVAIGTYVAPKPKLTPSRSSNCSPNYSGCVPNASDVDCAGGSGNGPAYTGPVRVTGYDVYGLDRDGDGYACE